MKIKIEITQTLKNVVEVEASNETEALYKVTDKFIAGEYPLDERNLEELDIRVVKERDGKQK